MSVIDRTTAAEEAVTHSQRRHLFEELVGATPEPINETVAVLTPRGHAAVAIRRLERRLRELEDTGDRAVCIGMLSHLLDDLCDGLIP